MADNYKIIPDLHYYDIGMEILPQWIVLEQEDGGDEKDSIHISRSTLPELIKELQILSDEYIASQTGA